MNILEVKQPQIDDSFVENVDSERLQNDSFCSLLSCRTWRQYPAQMGVFFNCASIVFIAAQTYPLASLALQGGSLLCHLFSSKTIARQTIGKSFMDNVRKFSKENKKFDSNKKELTASIQKLEIAIAKYENKVEEARKNKEALLLRMEEGRFEQKELLKELTEAAKGIELLNGVVESLKEQHRDAVSTILRLEEENRSFLRQLEQLGLLTGDVNESLSEVEVRLKDFAAQNRRHEEFNRQLEGIISALQEQNAQIEHFFSLYKERVEALSLAVVNLDLVDDLFAKGAKELRQVKQDELQELRQEVYKLNRCIDLLAGELGELKEQESERVRPELERIVSQLQGYVKSLDEFQESTARIQRQASVAHIVF